ncbi:MAG TPA: helix-turn-helix domain-containing protein [Pyrinomonadaceae bacterium]|nr:helix-turn-helix domain-containing protein [Pyrinomonadaceae bacterium]
MYKKSLRRLNETVSISSDVSHKRLDALRTLLHQMESEVQAIGEARPDLEGPVDFFREVEHFEIELIRSALRRTGGHQLRAAKLLGLNGTTLNSKIKRYGIDMPFARPMGEAIRDHETGRWSQQPSAH